MAPGEPGMPSSDGRLSCYGVRLTVLRMSGLWSANSAETITMIALAAVPVIASTDPAHRWPRPLDTGGGTGPDSRMAAHLR